MKVVLKNSTLVFQTAAPPQTFNYNFELTQGKAKDFALLDFATTANGQYFKITINDPDGCLDSSAGCSLAAGSSFVAPVNPNTQVTVQVDRTERISSRWTVYAAANKVLQSGNVTIGIELYG